MISGRPSTFAPRSPSSDGAPSREGAGAQCHAPRHSAGAGGAWRRPISATGALAAALLTTPVSAQEPPDSLQVADSVAVLDSATVADSLALLLGQEADSVSADTIFYNMPIVESRLPDGYATGVWEWDRHLIMASGASTLAELLETIPGLIPLLGGDYGTPAAMSAFGQGGAGYRVIRDGLELYALDGGVADLQRIGLAGIARVRLDRSMAQMVVEMWSHAYDDGRPFSVIEAGTGDLDTNMFRGVYADPTALFGSIAVGLERLDTGGPAPGRAEGGNRTGSWARYQLHLRERAAIGFEFRQMSSSTKVPDYLPMTKRRELAVRLGGRVADGLVIEGFTARSRHEVEAAAGEYTQLGGRRAQHGGRVGLDLGPLWANGSVRLFEGDLPSRRIDAQGGLVLGRLGAVGRVARASWNDVGTSNFGARAWAEPLPGLTLFGAYESGDFGSRAAAVEDLPPRPPLQSTEGIQPGLERISERETLRVGGMVSRWGVTLGGAALYAHSDSMLPFGTELDTGSPAFRGAHRNGWEAMAVLPTLWEGLTIEGSYQWWDEEGPYLPGIVYRGSFEFHRVYKESENLEFWGSLGVRGHDPSLVFVADDGTGVGGVARVPFYQSWYARIQVRVVTVRLFVGIDNFTIRRNLQNYPDRILPFGRSFFGLRWDMWN